MELANTTLTVYRGSTVNRFGDQTDVGTAICTGLPAAVVESSRTTMDPATQTPRTIRTSTAVVPRWADILTTDTLQDERTGNYYMIITVTDQPTLGPPPDKLLTLRWRSGISPKSD